MGLTAHSFFNLNKQLIMINIPVSFLLEVVPAIAYYGSAFFLALLAFTWHKSQDLNQSK